MLSTRPDPISFRLDGFHNREARRWRDTRNGVALSWETVARNHAREHGAAGAYRADGSLVLFYRDGDTVRRRTWQQARPV